MLTQYIKRKVLEEAMPLIHDIIREFKKSIDNTIRETCVDILMNMTDETSKYYMDSRLYSVYLHAVKESMRDREDNYFEELKRENDRLKNDIKAEKRRNDTLQTRVYHLQSEIDHVKGEEFIRGVVKRINDLQVK